MGLLSWVIFGAIVGWLASKLAGTDSQQGWIANIILGVLGATLGGIVWGWIDDSRFVIDWSIGSLILGVVGAFVLSWGYSFLMGRNKPDAVATPAVTTPKFPTGTSGGTGTVGTGAAPKVPATGATHNVQKVTRDLTGTDGPQGGPPPADRP